MEFVSKNKNKKIFSLNNSCSKAKIPIDGQKNNKNKNKAGKNMLYP